MNDAVESFLVFKEAALTGTYQEEYEGELEARLDESEGRYVLAVYQALLGMSSNLTVEIQRDTITSVPALYNTFLPDILVYHAGWQADTPIVLDIHILLPKNVRFHYNQISVPPASNSEKTAYTQSLPDIPQAHICVINENIWEKSIVKSRN